MNKYIWGIVALIVVVGGYFLLRGGQNTQVDNSTSTPIASSTDNTGSTSVPGSSIGVLKLRIGESGNANGITLKPISVSEDSRCPAGVYCIQAGTVKILVQVTSSKGTTQLTMELGKPITRDAEDITLTIVNPLKTSASTIKSSDYAFTFTVSEPNIQAS
ncbi:hypothetical protein KW790_02785 [Candidatus Parcubacteria bacterium]|nr:hypothetical protein [Candidatus Parcubacteria bacterium]